ncbi:DUF3310 domain-containing protein [Mammaliicoccus sciuri]|uniref:DUF3310 domain-containing protein n=1 Tax=Mammaliicoccus sciuri TaxID=1296 RepID=UPI0020BE9578|nr:DUF3310 domain-containing protein [Mammaliicoccus sciuri]
MEFKAGDRVHVTRLDGEKVDFYGTINRTGTNILVLINCTDYRYENRQIYTSNSRRFGPNKTDYYTLATDEEDTEEPVIQRINDMYNDVPTHYKADIDVIEFCRQHFTDEEFKGAMKFNLIKYPTRLGRKDDMVKELDKIIDYAQRYKEVLENEPTQ